MNNTLFFQRGGSLTHFRLVFIVHSTHVHTFQQFEFFLVEKEFPEVQIRSALPLCWWTNCSVKAEIPISLFHFAPSEFTYPSPSALLAESLEVCLQMHVSASAGWEEKEKKKYYTNENPLVFIKMLTLYTDFVYGIICNKFVSLGCWFFSTTISILGGEWQQYCVSCWVARTRKGLISGVYIFLLFQ